MWFTLLWHFALILLQLWANAEALGSNSLEWTRMLKVRCVRRIMLSPSSESACRGNISTDASVMANLQTFIFQIRGEYPKTLDQIYILLLFVSEPKLPNPNASSNRLKTSNSQQTLWVLLQTMNLKSTNFTDLPQNLMKEDFFTVSQ